jgi:hypothetical protein
LSVQQNFPTGQSTELDEAAIEWQMQSTRVAVSSLCTHCGACLQVLSVQQNCPVAQSAVPDETAAGSHMQPTVMAVVLLCAHAGSGAWLDWQHVNMSKPAVEVFTT